MALAAVGIISVVFSLYFEGNVILVWKTLGSFSAACLLFPILIGQCFPGAVSEKSFCWAVSFGCIGIVSWTLLNKLYAFSSIDEFYVGLLFTSIPLLPSLLRKKA